MRVIIQITIDYFSRKPSSNFLLDGLGGALTTFSLFFVLRHNYDHFGMQANILTSLSLIGLVYSVFSMSCYFLLKDYWTPSTDVRKPKF